MNQRMITLKFDSVVQTMGIPYLNYGKELQNRGELCFSTCACLCKLEKDVSS